MKGTKKNGMSASEYIRSQPSTMTATEIHAKAQREGFRFQPNLVYAVRSADRLKAKGPSVKAVKPATNTVQNAHLSDAVQEAVEVAVKDITEKVTKALVSRILSAVAA